MSHDQPQSGSETPYLELLARGAAADAYERPVLVARADGATPETLAALETAKLHALRVRAELEGRRRREAELSALYETAHDLAGLRDLDAVLAAIVQRARSLLGTEVAYLSLNDPVAGDTYMRVTEGSVSARFQQLRLGMGEGLGGLVAQTARPYATESYFDDPRFQHTWTIDSGVRDEGLVAILGVPLTLGSQVIGVLFAADRRARVFEREQIALLGSFAAHAAVAIDTANLLAETRSALAELEKANEIIRDRSGVIERASDVHDRLTELVLRGGGVDDVARAVSEVLDGTVEFTDAEGEPTGADGHAVRCGDDWVATVSAGGELLGALVLHGHPALDPVDQRTLERAAMVTSLLLLARRSAGEAEQRVRGELLDDLLDAPDRDPRLLRERAARLRADLDASHVVLAARIEAPRTASVERESADRRRLWSAASHLAATGQGLAAPATAAPYCCSRWTAVTAPRPSHAGRRSTWEAPCASPSRSDPRDRWTRLRPAPVRWRGRTRKHALRRRAAAARRCGEGAAAEDFGFLGLLLADSGDGRSGGAVEAFVRRTIGEVVEYDRRRGTDLVRTLDAYFACGMSPARTKDELHVHVNTVAQRLERIGRLLGADWQSPERALEVQLALRLHGLLSAITR